MIKYIKSEKERAKIIAFMKKERIIVRFALLNAKNSRFARIQKIESENLIKRIMLNQRSREINFKLLCL